jgi:hypothetical protein
MAFCGKSGQVPAAVDVMKLLSSFLRTAARAANDTVFISFFRPVWLEIGVFGRIPLHGPGRGHFPRHDVRFCPRYLV